MRKLTPIQVAKDLHKIHQLAAAVSDQDPQQIVYSHQDLLKLFKKYHIVQPDFAGLTMKGNNKKDSDLSEKKYLLMLSKKIQNARIAKKWTPKELATQMHVSVATITRYESAQNLTTKTILKLQKVLDIALLSV